MNHKPAKPTLGHVLDVFGQTWQSRPAQGIGGHGRPLINRLNVDSVFIRPLVRIDRQMNVPMHRGAIRMLNDIIEHLSQDN